MGDAGDQIEEGSSKDAIAASGPAASAARPIFPILALIILLILVAILSYRLFF